MLKCGSGRPDLRVGDRTARVNLPACGCLYMMMACKQALSGSQAGFLSAFNYTGQGGNAFISSPARGIAARGKGLEHPVCRSSPHFWSRSFLLRLFALCNSCPEPKTVAGACAPAHRRSLGSPGGKMNKCGNWAFHSA